MDAQSIRGALAPVVAQLRHLSSILRGTVSRPAELGRGLLDPQIRRVESLLVEVDDEIASGEFPRPRRKDGEQPCGECHLHPGETCDICGAVAALTPETAEAVPVAAQPVDAVREALVSMVTDYLQPATYTRRFPANRTEWETNFPMPHENADAVGKREANERRDAAFIKDVIRLQEQPFAALASVPAPAGDAEPVSVNEYAANYYFATDDGDYTPLEGERAMIEDAINGYLAAHPDPELTRLREELERVTRERDVLTALVADQTVKLTAKDVQLDDARRENRTAREDERDRLYQETMIAFNHSGYDESFRTAGIVLERWGAMLPAKRAALRASTAGSQTDGDSTINTTREGEPS